MSSVDETVNCYSTASVGYEDDRGPHMVWFSRWFLDLCHFDAPQVIWQRDERKITQTRKETGEQRIWMLTDDRDRHGFRLGVWPD